MYTTIILMFLLQVKHLIFDWFWQPPYEYKNKGTYGHFGGILHALKSGFGTFLCFWILPAWFPWISFPLVVCIFIGLLEAFIHYHIDYAKVNLNKRFGWRPDSSENFWRLTGLDQFLHQVTYIVLIFLAWLILLM